ncbi:MAG: type IV secretory system conjugative DNA transfer family protein [Bacteroidales bacterium]|nr:type IV secretory system conjugative DNA transfer family protein [Bacteroidales bacterium]
MNKSEYEKYAEMALFLGICIIGINLIYYFYPMAYRMGLKSPVVWDIFETVHRNGLFSNPYKTKLPAILIYIFGNLIRTGRPTERKIGHILVEVIAGLVLYLLPFSNILLYILSTTIGFILIAASTAHLARFISLGMNDINTEDTFDQMTQKITNQDSINLPMKFHWKGKWNKGWINVINPFRMILVQGAPGSGKSYSIFEPAFFQFIKKGFVCFTYDFKFPDQTTIIYNLYEKYKHCYKKEPSFHVVNFDNPMYSERCNPIDPKFLNDPADATEVSEIVMENVNKGAQGGQKFFDDSAKLYLDAIVWFLRKYKDGKYCTFPHAIELMAVPYSKTLKIMKNYPELEVKLKPFEEAFQNKALEQLSGQIASAQIPLNKFVSPSLYYVLSANEFDLDLNNPDDPKILCLGNNPDRQAIYGATSALMVSRIIKVINHKGKTPMFFSLDELPTIFIKGLDNLAATARSHKVALIAGVQTKAQLERDYNEKEAKVINENIGNFFIGATTGTAAEQASKMFGKQKIISRSISTGDSDSVSISYRDEDRLSADRIETLHQGTFCGKVADNNDQPIQKPLFCAQIIRDKKEIEEMKTFKKMPLIKDFGREKIRERVFSNPREYLSEALYDDAIKKFHEEGGTTIIPSVIDNILTDMINKTSEDRIKEILENTVENKTREAMEEEVMRVYQQIRTDVAISIVETELNRIMEEERIQKENDMKKKREQIDYE